MGFKLEVVAKIQTGFSFFFWCDKCSNNNIWCLGRKKREKSTRVYSQIPVSFSPCLIHSLFAHFVAIFLEASGSVQNGSTAHYDATTAKLELQFQMLIHKFTGEVKSPGIKYRIELVLVNGSKENMNDHQIEECNLAYTKFSGYCKARHVFTPINQQLSDDYMVILNLSFI